MARRKAPDKPGCACIDFEDAIAIWEGTVLEVPSAQLHRGEQRILAVGRCEDRIITVVFTWRGKSGG